MDAEQHSSEVHQRLQDTLSEHRQQAAAQTADVQWLSAQLAAAQQAWQQASPDELARVDSVQLAQAGSAAPDADNGTAGGDVQAGMQADQLQTRVSMLEEQFADQASTLEHLTSKAQADSNGTEHSMSNAVAELEARLQSQAALLSAHEKLIQSHAATSGGVQQPGKVFADMQQMQHQQAAMQSQMHIASVSLQQVQAAQATEAASTGTLLVAVDCATQELKAQYEKLQLAHCALAERMHHTEGSMHQMQQDQLHTQAQLRALQDAVQLQVQMQQADAPNAAQRESELAAQLQQLQQEVQALKSSQQEAQQSPQDFADIAAGMHGPHARAAVSDAAAVAGAACAGASSGAQSPC